MRSIPCEALGAEAIQGLGRYVDLVHCASYKIGEMPVEFYRDMACGTFGNGAEVAFSVVKCQKRPMVIDEIEQHYYTKEGLLPLDGDVVVFVAAATNRTVPEEWRAFLVPKGTLVLFDQGVWHKAPFPVTEEVVHSLVILPPMTYANDCYVISLAEDQKVEICL